MKEDITAKNNTELACIVDQIHDYWFDLEKIKFDEFAQILVIPCSSDKHCTKNCFLLQVSNVVKLTIKDTEQVGFYNFNQISYEKECKEVRFSTGIPLGFVVDVLSLQVSLSPMV